MNYKRLVLGFGLLVTIYMMLLAWNEDYGQQSRSQKPTNDNTASQYGNESTISTIPQSTSVNGEEAPDFIPEIAVSISPKTQSQIQSDQDRFIYITTDVLQVTIDKIGGDIVSVSLPDYPVSLDMPDKPFSLVDPMNDYSAQTGLIGPSGTDTRESRPTFSSQLNNYTMDNSGTLSVELAFEQKSGARIVKEFNFTASDYLIDIIYRIQNSTDQDWSGAIYGQIKRDSRQPQGLTGNAMMMQPFVGGATRTEETSYNKLEFDEIEESSFTATYIGGYMALVQHYFVSAFVPDPLVKHNYQARKLSGKDTFIFGFTSPLWVVPVGAQDSQAMGFYVGPKDQYRLRELADGLDLTIDYGFLWWLAQPIFWLLTKIQEHISSNWGVAIMLLTLCVKSALYPLSAASYRSMAKMRKLQPELLRLREQFGDDKQKLSKAMMELYKKGGANPLGGCLPMLLQMPVFLALYWVLMESVELRQAPFILWIDDLAAMDPYFVLPILMGISMYFVTAMQPVPADPMQAKIFKWMPILFTFLFVWFPAGLVLYWLVNNVISLCQQWYVTRQIESGQ